MRGWTVLGLLAVAGCSTVTLEGRIVDGLSGLPIAGPYRIKAKALSQDAAIACQFLDGEVTAEGTFRLEGLCPGTGYQLEAGREDVWIVDGDQVPEGGWAQPTDLTAWRAPKGSGVYKLSGGVVEPLRTDAEVKVEKIWGTDSTVRYPATVPTELSRVGPDDHLVLVGKTTVEEMKLWPLVDSGPRKFGDESQVWTMEPWSYVGTRFVDDSTFEVVTAAADPAKVVDKEKGQRHARFVSGAALPAGRYALLRDDDRRLYLLEFGAPPAE